MTDLTQRVLARIDATHAADPRRTLQGFPVELDHAQRMTAWVERLCFHPSDALRVAARGQHIERWTRPRSEAPADRGGYLRWRESLKIFHAQRVAGLMREEGCPEPEIQRVEELILKRAARAGDPEGQILEDALCLVFFETQFETLRAKTPDEKMKSILEKTWRKMSETGRAEALKLSLPDEVRELLSPRSDPASPPAAPETH